MDYVCQFIDLFLHLDKHLAELVQAYGGWAYLLLFIIVFCETGLVVTPILPGDSLLFAAGAIAGLGSLNPHLLVVLLTVAAVLGDAVNYQIGRYLGPAVFNREKARFFKREHLDRTQAFYERYGGKTIIIARFVPIVRTFAPFLAGVGQMNYGRFAMYNVTGAIAWVVIGVYAGYFFGTLEIVKENFSLIIIAIVLISLLPAVVEYARARRAPTA
ncbi:MAG: DedA family protein [Planctomycetota bacterium]|nr:MAG: DedA family protein [Planctomycetota bacterium]